MNTVMENMIMIIDIKALLLREVVTTVISIIIDKDRIIINREASAKKGITGVLLQ